MNKRYSLLLSLFLSVFAIKTSELGNSENYFVYYCHENNDNDNNIFKSNIRYYDIKIDQSTSFIDSNIDKNPVHSQEYGDNNNNISNTSHETNSIIVISDSLSHDDLNEKNNLKPLDHYAKFFTDEWETKEIVFTDMQDKTLGLFCKSWFSAPLNTLNCFVNNKDRKDIDIQKNLSILRIISNLVKTYLIKDKLDDLKNVLAIL